MRSICFIFVAAALVATLPDDDFLTISPNPSSEDLLLFDTTSNNPTKTLGGDDDNLFLDASNNAADFFSTSNVADNSLVPTELKEASCSSGIDEQPLSKRSEGEGICDLNSPHPIGHLINDVRNFFGIQANEEAISSKKDQKCLPPYLVHLCCTTEGPLILGSALIHEYMQWCQSGTCDRLSGYYGVVCEMFR